MRLSSEGCAGPLQPFAALDAQRAFLDLDYEWQKLVNDLNTRCQEARVPFMVEALPADYVARPQEFEALIEKLLDQQREEPVAITAALRVRAAMAKRRWQRPCAMTSVFNRPLTMAFCG